MAELTSSATLSSARDSACERAISSASLRVTTAVSAKIMCESGADEELAGAAGTRAVSGLAGADPGADPGGFWPLNSVNRVFDRARYLPSFTEDAAYITTKKANSRVTRSP